MKNQYQRYMLTDQGDNGCLEVKNCHRWKVHCLRRFTVVGGIVTFHFWFTFFSQIVVKRFFTLTTIASTQGKKRSTVAHMTQKQTCQLLQTHTNWCSSIWTTPTVPAHIQLTGINHFTLNPQTHQLNHSLPSPISLKMLTRPKSVMILFLPTK